MQRSEPPARHQETLDRQLEAMNTSQALPDLATGWYGLTMGRQSHQQCSGTCSKHHRSTVDAKAGDASLGAYLLVSENDCKSTVRAQYCSGAATNAAQ